MTTKSLVDKLAVVFGAGAAGNGICNGRAAATRLAEVDARVALLDVRDSGERTRRMFEERDGSCIVYKYDVTDPVRVSEAIYASNRGLVQSACCSTMLE